MKEKQASLAFGYLITVVVLLAYALSTTNGHHGYPSVLGWIALAIVGLFTWAMFDGL